MAWHCGLAHLRRHILLPAPAVCLPAAPPAQHASTRCSLAPCLLCFQVTLMGLMVSHIPIRMHTRDDHAEQLSNVTRRLL